MRDHQAIAARVPNAAEVIAAGAEGALQAAQTLLLVDDEDNILAALRRSLRSGRYRVLAVTNGAEGLELLRGNDVDLIIADQRMPGMSGVEFLREAKLVRPDAIRMVLSGYTELQSITDAINEGAIYKFLTKPWDDAELCAVVAAALVEKAAADDVRRAQRELAAAHIVQGDRNVRLESLVVQQRSDIERDEISLHVAHEILQHIPVPVIGVDTTEMITFANTAALETFAASGSMLGADARDVLPPALLSCPAGDGRARVVIECAGRLYAAMTRTMGEHSSSQGRIYVLLPT